MTIVCEQLIMTSFATSCTLPGLYKLAVSRIVIVNLSALQPWPPSIKLDYLLIISRTSGGWAEHANIDPLIISGVFRMWEREGRGSGDEVPQKLTLIC